ncbi:hypothetical protein [Pontibacter flavimaris]|uniref:hypothetical protein n=1 Tax=Pontibacter flavimaris TaxID=1797110 RepID=UPI0011153A24|nr:hypothetical protein [Pontibacter flavimaris]
MAGFYFYTCRFILSLAQASACASLYLLFRTSLSGTTAAADFLIRVSHTFILDLYFHEPPPSAI